MGSALVEGLGSRYFMATADFMENIERTAPDGSVDEWSLYAIAFEQIIWTFFEPIDPSEWESY